MKFNPIKILQNFIKKSRLSGIIIALISFILIALLSFTTVYDQFEFKLYDLKFNIKPSITEWDKLAFLNVDDQSLKNLGEYPWPRNVYAEGLDVLKEIGVRLNTFDFEFLEKTEDRLNFNAFNNLYEKILKGGKIDVPDILNLPQSNDEILATSIKDLNRVMLPYHFDEEKYIRYDISKEEQPEWDRAKEFFLKKASVKLTNDELDKYSSFIDDRKVDLALPIPEMIFAARGFGYVDRDPDIDGIERRIRLVRVFKDRLFFQMGLAMVMDICGVDKQDVEIIPGSKIVLKNALNPITFIKEDIEIPIDNEGKIYINWAGPGGLEESFQSGHISFYALVEYPLVKEMVIDTLDEKDFKNELKLGNLYKILSEKRKLFNKTDIVSEKGRIWKEIDDIKNDISKTQTEYFNEIIDEFKDELKKIDDPDIKSIIQTFELAKDIVTKVESLQDKLTIIGLTAHGTQDLGAIPISSEYMMVGTFHNVVNTILNNEFIIPLKKYYNILIMLILSLIMGYIIQKLSAKVSIFVIVSAIVVINILNIGLFAFYNIWIEQIGTNLAVILPSFVIAGMKFMQEESQKRYIKGAFSHYLAPSVIDKIIESPEALELGGEEREVTSFFSDVAKFSTISEKLTPPQLVSLLNEYLSAMTDIILSHGGTVDKYEGDAIIAFYGAPHPFEDHALRCCYAAIDMKKRLREMQDNWRRLGTDVLQVRMGMNSGKAVVGNMGSRTRMDYTAMGDTINLASRLEGANKFYSTYAMISESTYKVVKDEIEVRKLDTVRVVGKEEPIVIYELLGKKGQLPDRMYAMMEKYYEALEFFGNREWKKAITKFREGLKIIEDDGPSLKYTERCEQYLKRPPSKKWDGVYKFTSK